MDINRDDQGLLLTNTEQQRPMETYRDKCRWAVTTGEQQRPAALSRKCWRITEVSRDCWPLVEIIHGDGWRTSDLQISLMTEDSRKHWQPPGIRKSSKDYWRSTENSRDR